MNTLQTTLPTALTRQAQLETEVLTETERRAIALAEKVAEQMNKGAHLDDWLVIGEALLAGRKFALKVSRSRQPMGRRYAEAFSGWLRGHPHLLDLHERGGHMTAASMWLIEDPGRLQVLADLRAAMSPKQRAELSHPVTAKRLIVATVTRAGQNAPAGDDDDADGDGDTSSASGAAAVTLRRPSPLEAAKAEIERLEGELEDARERIAALESQLKGSGSIDLVTDRLEDIKAVIDQQPHKSSIHSRFTKIRAFFDAWCEVPVKR